MEEKGVVALHVEKRCGEGDGSRWGGTGEGGGGGGCVRSRVEMVL